jgi:hypothetical protein
LSRLVHNDSLEVPLRQSEVVESPCHRASDQQKRETLYGFQRRHHELVRLMSTVLEHCLGHVRYVPLKAVKSQHFRRTYEA